MTIVAFILILVSVFLHAGWNFLCKSHRPSPNFTLVLNAATMVMLLPFLFFVKIEWGNLPPSFWWMISLSISANVLYCIALAQAYRYGDISVSYPLCRSLSVLVTAFMTWVFHLGKPLSVNAIIGFGILFIGCIVLPQKCLRNFSCKNIVNTALLFVLLTALGTSGYTIGDSIASACFAKCSSSNDIVIKGAYFCILQICVTFVQWIILTLFSRHAWQELRQTLSEPYPYIAGVFNCACYLLVLLAMSHATNVCLVQAFRQMSLPIGVFAGIFFLREPLTYMKIAGTALIVFGLIMTVL